MASTHQVCRLLYSRLASKQLRRRVKRIESAGLKNWRKERALDKKTVDISCFKKEEDLRTAGYQHLAWQAWQGNAESGFRTHLATTFDAIML